MEGGIVEGAGLRASSGGDDAGGGEGGVCGRRNCVEVGCCGEAVDEGGFATEIWFIDPSGAGRVGGGGGGVREEMEELETTWVSEIGCVGMGGEGEGGVGCINWGGLGSEVPEAAIVGDPDGGEAVEEGLGGFWCARCGWNECEAVLVDLSYEGLEASGRRCVHE